MKALAFLILSFPLFSWAHLVGVQVLQPGTSDDQVLDFDFGNVPVGETYYTLFTLTAPTDKDLKLEEISIVGDMYSGATECAAIIPAGTSCETEVDFAPTSKGEHLGELKFVTALGNIIVNLKGAGVEPASN